MNDEVLEKVETEEWELRGPDGTGWQIYARLPELDKAAAVQVVPISPTLHVGPDDNVTACIAYETWRQFPSPDWRKMQERNARLMAGAPKMALALDTVRRHSSDWAMRELAERVLREIDV